MINRIRNWLIGARRILKDNARLRRDQKLLLDKIQRLEQNAESITEWKHKLSLYWHLESYVRRLEAELRVYRKEKIKEWGDLGLGDHLSKQPTFESNEEICLKQPSVEFRPFAG